MISPEQKNKIVSFLKQHPVAVLATADMDGNPAAAVVLFAATDDLSLIFGTHPTRKYSNLQINPKAALAITKGAMSIQYHGPAKELAGQELDEAKAVFMAKHPEANKQLLEGTKFFKVTPALIRYMDMSQQPMEKFELSLAPGDWR